LIALDSAGSSAIFFVRVECRIGGPV